MFIFGGQLSGVEGPASFNNSVEVFDVQREICRRFDNQEFNQTKAKGPEVCVPLSHFQAA